MKIKDKIKTREELSLICEKLRKQGKKIGFTSGSFDIMHAGHASYLEKAKEMCDVLIVGVNSDLSVKKYKGPDKPIIPEKERIGLIAALSPVDYAFLFDGRRNKENIEILKPDFYIKAGDYKIEELTSREYIEKYGGKAVLIPLEEGISTTEITKKILKIHESEKDGSKTVSLDTKPLKACNAVFFDRDGVINEEIEYLHEPEKFKILPGVLEVVKTLQDMGYKIVIVTTQAGIGLGYYTKEDFYRVNKEMLKAFSGAGIIVDKIYFCPHGKNENCKCRKPEIGLIERAKEDLNIDLSRSFMIGDKTSDILAGQKAGTKTILVKTGHAGKDKEFAAEPDYIADNIIDAAKWIKEVEGK